jgi:hypothetical protein
MKPRAHIYFDEALARQFDLLAERPGASKSAIAGAALKIAYDLALHWAFRHIRAPEDMRDRSPRATSVQLNFVVAAAMTA